MNLVFEDKACNFTKNTPGQKMKKQSGPEAPPSMLAGILKASPPRKGEKVLELFRPARNHPHWQPSRRRERITWLQEGVEHQWERGVASVSEAEKQPSRQLQITTAMEPAVCLRL
jgi:hypothetical protein